jgi:glycosyltransferase involved in cell wall biosynthesis
VDDCSETRESIIQAVQDLEDKRFRLIRAPERLGPGSARNLGANSSRGRFLLFVDEDDELRPECVEKLFKTAEKTGAAFVSPWAELFGASEGIWRARAPEAADRYPAMNVLGAGVLIERNWWLKVGGYDESEEIQGREDVEFWIRAALSGGRFEIVEEPLYRYRRAEPELSLSIVTAKREARVRKAIVKKHWNLFASYGGYWRKFLAGGYKSEAVWDWSHENYFSALWKSMIACTYYPCGKTVRDVVKVIFALIRKLILREDNVVFS